MSQTVLSLSTCWASDRPSAAGLLAAIRATGLTRLELEYRLTAPFLAEIRRELRPQGLSVGSVHNYCPFPPEMEGKAKPSGDLFNLASPDKKERLLALRHTQASLELASDLEAGVVVLHLGWVPGQEDRQVTSQAALAGALTPELAQARQARVQASPRVLDAVSFSLETLLERARALGVCLGLENRFHLFQVPNLEETQALLRRFAGGPLGYWHDTGHARHRELAGLNGTREYLDCLGASLVGCHLHDVKGVEDHRPPGDGDLDWAWLAPRLLPAPVKVVELRAGPSPQAVGESARWLAGIFDQAQAAQERKDQEASSQPSRA